MITDPDRADATDADTAHTRIATVETAGMEAAEAEAIDKESRRAVASGQIAFEHINVEGCATDEGSLSAETDPSPRFAAP
jgi:hypothetical protein